MQFILAAAAALVATTAASPGLVQRDSIKPEDRGFAKVVNRCSYPVYLWSIGKEMGCPSGKGTKLNTGESYSEQFKAPKFKDDGGISIKISKFPECGGKDITQLEYKIVDEGKYAGNYLDMSFVDCTGNLEDCPGRTDGFYMKSGNDDDVNISAVNNEHCPLFNVYNAEEAAKVSYINWDDPQTKFCNSTENLNLYLCGGDAPSADDKPVALPSPKPSKPEHSDVQNSPSPSSHSVEEQPTPSAPAATSSTEDAFVVAAAAVTPPPAPPAEVPVKTEVVYVTEYVNKRHAHGRRHQHFHA